MKVKVSELIGAALDWAVAKAEEKQVYMRHDFMRKRAEHTGFSDSLEWHLSVQTNDPIIGNVTTGSTQGLPRYSIDWSWTGPLFHNVDYLAREGDGWIAGKEMLPAIQCYKYQSYGKTELIAVARCLVSSKLGNEIEVPDELVKAA